MKEFKLEGFWREFNTFEAFDEFPSLQAALQQPIPLSNKQKILNFLTKGTPIGATRGIHFCETTRLGGTHNALTDGEWIGSENLIFYFRYNDIPLSPEFIEHMAQFHFKCPVVHRSLAQQIDREFRELRGY